MRTSPEPSSEIVLAHVPYVLLEEPSVALGTLQAAVQAAGFDCRVLYANMAFAEFIGLDIYQLINHLFRIPALGDWTFAGAAFPDYNPDHRRFLDFMAGEILKKNAPALRYDREARAKLVDVFYAVRARTPRFSADIAGRMLAFQPKIIGCSSNFEQHTAALSILRAARARDPDVITILGGANCEGIMGVCTARNYPWVDYVFSGEADDTFPEFCELTRRYGRSIPVAKLHPSIFRRDTVAALRGPEYPRAVCDRLDGLPLPDYRDYFDTLKKFRHRRHVRPALLFETSRGCWWGARRHCVFCGRNRNGNQYRMKSPARILREIKELSARHAIKLIGITDNILAPEHFKSVLPELEKAGQHYSLYAETKANLTREQVRLLAAAGFNWFQPGIEALHDEILQNMNKGTRTHINLQLLKYAREYGLRVCWNILYANPGDRDEWYAEIMQWLPHVIHFPPPTSLVAVFFSRHSPYFENQDQYGLALAPFDSYAKVYPLPPDQLHDQAYYFQNRGPWRQSDFFDREKFPAFNRLHAFIPKWRAAYFAEIPALLCMTEKPQGLDILDTRPGTAERRVLLKGAAADICRVCDPAVLPDRLPELLQKRRGVRYTDLQIESALGELHQRGIVIRLPNRRLLTVAMTGEIPAPAPTGIFPHGATSMHSIKRILETEHAALCRPASAASVQ